MKFLAILRDSLRETLDIKLFYVLVGMSLLTVLFAASVTYKPVAVEDRIKVNLRLANFAFRNHPELRKMKLEFEIEKFERLDDRKEPWLGDYRFDYLVRFSIDPKEAKNGDGPKPEKMKEELKKAMKPEVLENQFREFFRDVEVKEEKPAAKLPAGTEELRFQVTGKGTWIKSRQEWYHEPALFFGLVPLPIPLFPLSGIVQFIVKWVVGFGGAAFTILLSIIFTSWILPNMLAKGTVDLLIVKPIHRPSLLVYKFLGGLLFMFLNTLVIMTGLFLALGLQAGTWLPSMFLLILVYTFEFAVIYSVSALTAVLTRSVIVCILTSLMAWGFLFTLGWAHWLFIENQREGGQSEATAEVRNHWAFVGFDVLYRLTPRYKEIDWLGDKMLEEDLIRIRPGTLPPPDDKDYERRQQQAKEIHAKQTKALEKRYKGYDWTSALTVTSLFIAVMLGVACWRFSVKDY